MAKSQADAKEIGESTRVYLSPAAHVVAVGDCKQCADSSRGPEQSLGDSRPARNSIGPNSESPEEILS